MAEQPPRASSEWPKKAIEAEDPYEGVIAHYPVPDRDVADAETARCLAEEYARIGFPAARILRLFQIPTYAGLHEIYLRQGEAFVLAILESIFGQPVPTVPVVSRPAGQVREG